MTSTAISTQGLDMKVNVAATPTTIQNARGFTQSAGSREEIDVTHLLSTGKEYLLGLPDNGTFSIEFDSDYSDPAQNELESLYKSGAAGQFTFTFVDGRTLTFAARVSAFNESATIDDALRGTADLRVTGDVTRAAA